MPVQYSLFLSIIFTVLLQTSLAADTLFTRVKVNDRVYDFEMERGGTYTYSFGGDYGAETLEISQTENESIKCVLRGHTWDQGVYFPYTTRPATYGSPATINDAFSTAVGWPQLICYDNSDKPNSAVLILDPNPLVEASMSAGEPSVDPVYIVTLDANNEGVALLPPNTHRLRHAEIVETSHREMWCRVGREFKRDHIIGFSGANYLNDVTLAGDAVACTTRARPGHSYIYNSPVEDRRAVARHLYALTEAAKEKAVGYLN